MPLPGRHGRDPRVCRRRPSRRRCCNGCVRNAIWNPECLPGTLLPAKGPPCRMPGPGMRGDRRTHVMRSRRAGRVRAVEAAAQCCAGRTTAGRAMEGATRPGGPRPRAGLRAVEAVHGLSDEPDHTRRGSSFPTGRSRTTSFRSSRCTPFVTFCNSKCLDCVNHVRFHPTESERFSGLLTAFTKRFVSEQPGLAAEDDRSTAGRRTADARQESPPAVAVQWQPMASAPPTRGRPHGQKMVRLGCMGWGHV